MLLDPKIALAWPQKLLRDNRRRRAGQDGLAVATSDGGWRDRQRSPAPHGLGQQCTDGEQPHGQGGDVGPVRSPRAVAVANLISSVKPPIWSDFRRLFSSKDCQAANSLHSVGRRNLGHVQGDRRRRRNPAFGHNGSIPRHRAAGLSRYQASSSERSRRFRPSDARIGDFNDHESYWVSLGESD